MALLNMLILALVAGTASAADQVGCPACGAATRGRKIATVHPGEPANMLFDIKTPEECKILCKTSSPDTLFYQHFKSAVQGGEPSCLCLATCYSTYEADPSEEAVMGSLCRDLPCPSTCSNAPSPDVMFLGNPSHSIFQNFAYALYGGNRTVNGSLGVNGTFGGNATLFSGNATRFMYSSLNSTLLGLNGTMFSNSTNGTMFGNATVAAVVGMSFEECRAFAASSVSPPTPFFTHLEAMSACLMFDKCMGIAPAGTSTAKSGSFCVPSLLRGQSKSTSQQVA